MAASSSSTGVAGARKRAIEEVSNVAFVVTDAVTPPSDILIDPDMGDLCEL